MGAIYKHMKVTFYRVNQIAFCKETLTTFGLYPTIRLSLCHPERSGIAIKWRTKKPMNAAQSNPEGAPAGGISALTQGQAFTGHLTLGTPFMPRARTVSVRARVFYEPSTTSGRSKSDDGAGVGSGSGSGSGSGVGSGVGSGSGSCGKSGAGGVGISSPPLMR